MEDDIGSENLPSMGLEDIESMKGLWKFKIRRAAVEEWALRDIRFLVYDDTDDHEDLRTPGIESDQTSEIYDSEDEETLKRAIEMSLQTDLITSENRSSISEGESSDIIRPVLHHQNGNDEDSSLQRAVKLSSKELNVPIMPALQSSAKDPPIPTRSPLSGQLSDNRGEKPCGTCSVLPEFPHDRKTRKYRLICPGRSDPALELQSINACTHYVAVSYCWPEPVFDADGQIIRTPIASKVRDLNGEIREARALDDVLDRAVDFANCCGLRMIWIDQECLPQPEAHSAEEEKEYQQLGVQAMDIVYNRAIATVGLHEANITSQRQANALKMLIGLDRFRKHESLELIKPEILDPLFRFLEMVIADRWYTRAWVIQEAISAGKKLFLAFRRGVGVSYPPSFRFSRNPTKHSLDAQKDQLSSGLISMYVEEFQGLIRVARRLLQERNLQPSPITYHSAYGPSNILEYAERLYPSFNSSKFQFQMAAPFLYGNRQSVNASTAVTLLRSRQCRDTQDKVAIVANLCNYGVRLNTNEVAKHCKSLRAAILSLALLNGDCSILVPEIYSPTVYEISNKAKESSRAGGLLSPYDNAPGGVHDHTILPNGALAPRASLRPSTDISQKGIPLPAYTWTVDRELDFTPVKEQFADVWHGMQGLRIIVDRFKDESTTSFRARQLAFTRHFLDRNIMQEAKREISSHGHIARDSAIWSGLNSEGVYCIADLDSSAIEADPVAKQKLAGIIFGILAHLNRIARCDPQAAGVANSIWQSVRTDSVRRNGMELPDFVSDELFVHPDILMDNFSALQLDKGPGNRYLQTWFVDRIMRHGKLWVGRYNRSRAPMPDNIHRKDPRDPNISSTQVLSREESGSPSSSPETPPKSPKNTYPLNNAPKTILRRQERLQIVSNLANMFILLTASGKDLSTTHNPGSYTYLAEALSQGIWSREADEARERELVSVFDVDGPCVVATPYNSEWEGFPRSTLRSMSTCWVAELVDDSAGREDSSPDVSPPVEEVGGKGEREESVEEIPDASTAEAEPEDGVGDQEVSLYRVLSKVRGLRQVMDVPFEVCFFV
ncbi:hypothetical protein BKA65DRAFT_162144 [Rhexocercosporidium sp. MPI-PUGE-AT-0058]|nr:hypothetical protein BKA65DRAFT_162144 [Rhexocercosporidium sp. MPI-PUGE-AT-0058]